ncbi:Stage II sporulation protein E (SpoIIE) [Streptomyces sp. ADI96-02]|nr:Stage II sporulation protein E (SpoIIE) [Streptomyces sp. ADI96-02]
MGGAVSDAESPASAGTPSGDLDEALLSTLFSQSAVGLVVLDPQLRLVRASPAVAGEPGGELIGRRFTDVLRVEHPDDAEHLLKRVLAGEGPVRDHLVRCRPRTAARHRSYLLSAFRVDGPEALPLGLVTAVVDVTEQERERAREDCLTAVREVVGGSLDVAATCREFVDAVAPALADLAVVEVVDEVLRGADPPVGPLPPDVPVRRAASRRSGAALGGDEAAGGERGGGAGGGRTRAVGGTRRLPPRTPYALAVSDLRPRREPLGPDTPWLHADRAGARLVAETGAHSLIVVPLTLRGAILGLVSLYRCGDREPFDDDDLELAVTAVTRAALGIDNARRYEREHVVAATVQRRLLPQGDRGQAAVETAHVLLPGRDSGCWFDTIALSGARTALVVGGVAGQGLQTAVAMGQLRTVIQALSGLDLEPEEVLARLKDTADRLARERAALPPGDALQSEPLDSGCVYGIYDPFTRTCTIARAGHPAPLVVAPDGSAVAVDVPEGPGLFSADSAPFATATVTLDEGSVLAFCTSSLLPDERAATRITDTLARTGRSLQQLCDDIVYELPDDTRSNGAALLLARTGTVSEHRVVTWDLAMDATAPATARLLVRDRLQGWDRDEDTIDATELIVSELITNAVHYGHPPLRLRLLLNSTLTCEVHDGSTASPHLRHARYADEGGRGLFIVSRLAAHWGTRHGPHGKVLWTEQELPDHEGSERSRWPGGS